MKSCSVIVLGATGDLTKRKIMPALYNLVKEEKLGPFIFVGAAIDESTPHAIIESAKKFVEGDDASVWKTIEDVARYQQLDFQNIDDFKKLSTLLDSEEQKYQLPGNRLVYCAASPHFFCDIARHLGESGVIKKKKNNDRWHRIIFEKPFGDDLAMAQSINKCIEQWFDEQQIYRVDHYLTKELIANIALVRFTNTIFEPLWNKAYIDSVAFVCSEEVGLEGRGAYYDHYGVLKDVVQSHMLQMLALIAMEAPETLTEDTLRTKKAEALKDIVPKRGLVGQYEGYQSEYGVAQDSQTPTFTMLELAVNNERWKGVPFYLIAGKHLDRKETYIRITFKTIVCALKESEQCKANVLTIRVYPEAGFSLSLNAKDPKVMHRTTQVAMDFCHSCLYPFVPKAYQILLQEVMAGEQSIGVRFDEIEQAWRVLEQIEGLPMKLYRYNKGNTGPKEAVVFAQKHNIEW